MLKHKIRKSRKNILSLLESVQDEEKTRKEIPEYSEITKNGKKGKKKNIRIDEGYYTEKSCDSKQYSRAKSETRGEEKGKPVRNEAATQATQAGGYQQMNYLIPLFIPCQLVRRSSPQEDYIWTLTGVKN